MAVGLGQSDGEPAPRAARQNPVLRNFFREEYLSFHPTLGPELFLEHYIDRRIDHFLDDSERDLLQLKKAFDDCRETRDLVQRQGSGRERVRGEEQLAARLERISKKAGQLKKKLSLVFPASLHYKSDFEFPPLRRPEVPLLDRELGAIGGRIQLLEEHLRNYLFRNTPVVSVGDLAEHDILVLLFEIRQICHSAEAALRPE